MPSLMPSMAQPRAARRDDCKVWNWRHAVWSSSVATRPSISKEIKLVDWVSGKQTWPPRHAVNPNYYQSDGRKHAYDCSSEWWKAGAAEADGCDGCCRLRNRSLFRGPRT